MRYSFASDADQIRACEIYGSEIFQFDDIYNQNVAKASLANLLDDQEKFFTKSNLDKTTHALSQLMF